MGCSDSSQSQRKGALPEQPLVSYWIFIPITCLHPTPLRCRFRRIFNPVRRIQNIIYKTKPSICPRNSFRTRSLPPTDMCTPRMENTSFKTTTGSHAKASTTVIHPLSRISPVKRNQGPHPSLSLVMTSVQLCSLNLGRSLRRNYSCRASQQPIHFNRRADRLHLQ